MIFFLLYIGQRQIENKILMAIMGSGGHTHEMLTLINTIIDDSESKIKRNKLPIEEIVFIVSNGDKLSEQKLKESFPQLNKEELNRNLKCRIMNVSRSRQVHQSYLSSIFTTLQSLIQSLRIMIKIHPRLLLCNGPGVCIPLIVATRLLSPNSLIVFVESFCRTRTLSLSGKIVYHLRLADHFLVQWPKLVKHYTRTRYLGGVLV